MNITINQNVSCSNKYNKKKIIRYTSTYFTRIVFAVKVPYFLLPTLAPGRTLPGTCNTDEIVWNGPFTKPVSLLYRIQHKSYHDSSFHVQCTTFKLSMPYHNNRNLVSYHLLTSWSLYMFWYSLRFFAVIKYYIPIPNPVTYWFKKVIL